jgi:dTMP kinase
MNRGRLITIEGIDGAGKTTLATGLVDALQARGLDVVLLREPGGVPAAERIRELVIDPGLHVTARTEALLYAAARAQLVEEALEPLLREGKWVLLDRFIDSSLAYQGGGRELGIETASSTPRSRTREAAGSWGSTPCARSTSSRSGPRRPIARCCSWSTRKSGGPGRYRASGSPIG